MSDSIEQVIAELVELRATTHECYEVAGLSGNEHGQSLHRARLETYDLVLRRLRNLGSLRQVPDGWVLVPREPTPEMVAVAVLALHETASLGLRNADAARNAWIAMVEETCRTHKAVPSGDDEVRVQNFYSRAMRELVEEGERATQTTIRARAEQLHKAFLANPAPTTSGTVTFPDEMTLLDRVEFALRDAGFDYDLAFKCAWLSEHGIDPRTNKPEPTTAQAGAELPELPEPVWDDSDFGHVYTADQMRAYAELARRGG